MTTPNVASPHQLYLLADHLKLSLLERQRAISLNLEPTKHDSQISRSLTTLQEGIQSLEASSSTNRDDLSRLKSQYDTLAAQFHPTTTTTSSSEPSTPNATSNSKSSPSSKNNNNRRSVRFRDDPTAEPTPRYTDDDAQEISDPIEAANRAALFSSSSSSSNNRLQTPYTDNDDENDAQPQLDNQQLYAQHSRTMAEQDSQLDELGQSVRRQRMLGLQMGEEMDEQNEMLVDVERGVDRHTGTLDRARRRLGEVARKSKGNGSWITIGILFCILILLMTAWR